MSQTPQDDRQERQASIDLNTIAAEANNSVLNSPYMETRAAKVNSSSDLGLAAGKKASDEPAEERVRELDMERRRLNKELEDTKRCLVVMAAHAEDAQQRAAEHKQLLESATSQLKHVESVGSMGTLGSKLMLIHTPSLLDRQPLPEETPEEEGKEEESKEQVIQIC